ncbi:hypothetical protein BDZ97DRAFT_1870222 [Flammula alnicola]|nr:hypothetical protein BDZ97DRAFT_1870222 [Flammula alnicola]
MGRRKIEIQPITHERNRSVTFLKRKNGLFKKAYELGVLCSVDVAVIIFEERPGHHVKLYQYGSSDIHDIVQRHIRHDGEKDTRGPPDFSGNSNSKLDDIAGDDDEDVDDDDDVPVRSKRRHDGKLKPPPDMVTGGMDYASHHRNVSIPQPPPLSLHGISGQSSGGGASLPISNDRGMPRDMNKRSTRLSLHPGHSRSPSDDLNPNTGPYSYHANQSSGPFTRGGQYSHHPSQHHQQHHSSNPQYQPFFPVSSHTSPPPSFIPLQSDFPRGPGSRGGGGGGGPGFGLPPRSTSSNPTQYENPGMYSGMVRNQSQGSSQPTGPGGGAGGGGDLFAAFLDADEQSRHQSQAQQGSGFVGLDWPVHGGGGGGAGSTAPSGPSSSVSNPSAGSSAGPDAPGGGNGNWLDFLSGNNPNAASAQSGRESMSWERGGGPSGPGGGDHGHRGDITDMFGASERGRAGSGAGGGGIGPGSPMVVGISGAKRSKGDDDVGGGPGGILASPASVNGRGGDGKKDGMKDGG